MNCRPAIGRIGGVRKAGMTCLRGRRRRFIGRWLGSKAPEGKGTEMSEPRNILRVVRLAAAAGLLAVAASVRREKKATADLTTQQIEDTISALDPTTRAAVIAPLTARRGTARQGPLRPSTRSPLQWAALGLARALRRSRPPQPRQRPIQMAAGVDGRGDPTRGRGARCITGTGIPAPSLTFPAPVGRRESQSAETYCAPRPIHKDNPQHLADGEISVYVPSAGGGGGTAPRTCRGTRSA